MSIHVDLKKIINLSVKLLGESVQEVYGQEAYLQIEDLRQAMKSVRGNNAEIVQKKLEEVYSQLKKENNERLYQITKSFSLMLELINCCESAFRVLRLKNYKVNLAKKPNSVVYVFTSHPTESRSQHFLILMDKIEQLLLESLNSSFDEIHGRLHHLLRIALRLSLANNRKPQVKDEMEQVFYTVLDDKILLEQIDLHKKGLDVLFRTWVGGDKDGHPGVGSHTMLQSFNMSRKSLLSFIKNEMDLFLEELELIGGSKKLSSSVDLYKKNFKSIKTLKPDDGKRVQVFKNNLLKLIDIAQKNHLSSPALENVKALCWLYPALVLPLEIREDSELIHKALLHPNQPIAKMLLTLKKISRGLDGKWYVRGFVISMCQSSSDLIAAAKLTKKILGNLAVPVVPLFENEKGLKNAKSILKESFKNFPFIKEHKKRWEGKFEVMLGYSDSSKENGVLPARLMVEKALNDVDDLLLSEDFKPVFFHGSGGSTSRGGGSVQEQVAWWPKSALNIYKVTIQGEMVQRNFNEPLIMRSQVGKIVESFANFKQHNFSYCNDFQLFIEKIQNEYRRLVGDHAFQELVTLATPYEYLSLLKIGSRPTKRAGKGKFALRAIPWILCWTQTRLILPVWWGVGSSWRGLSPSQKNKIKNDYENSPLLQSYVKNLGFTLAKVELGVWNFHVEHSKLQEEEKLAWNKIITSELNLAIEFFHEITNSKDYTWYRPWLSESIYFRSSMIHPLNVIQKIALERSNRILLRETVTGIACGMLTTG